MAEYEVIGWYHRLDGHVLSKLWEMVKDREALHVHEVTKSWTRLKRLSSTPWKESYDQLR